MDLQNFEIEKIDVFSIGYSKKVFDRKIVVIWKMCLGPQAVQSDVLHVLIIFFYYKIVTFYKHLPFF